MPFVWNICQSYHNHEGINFTYFSCGLIRGWAWEAKEVFSSYISVSDWVHLFEYSRFDVLCPGVILWSNILIQPQGCPATAPWGPCCYPNLYYQTELLNKLKNYWHWWLVREEGSLVFFLPQGPLCFSNLCCKNWTELISRHITVSI